MKLYEVNAAIAQLVDQLDVDTETGEVMQPEPQPFGPPANDVSAGVTVDAGDDDGF